MAFEAAVLSRLVAIREGDRFNQQCREQISPLKEERDALASLFVNLLTVPGAVPLLQLSDGKYVSLKTTTTTRAITEARLRAAIDAITPAQLARLEGRLVEAVEENLLDECTAIAHRPVVTVARPPHVSAQRPPARADPTVERSAQRLIAIDDRLKVLRQRQTAGRAQCRQAVGETDEVLHDWMAADGHHRRRIEVCPERAASPPAAPTPAPRRCPWSEGRRRPHLRRHLHRCASHPRPPRPPCSKCVVLTRDPTVSGGPRALRRLWRRSQSFRSRPQISCFRPRSSFLLRCGSQRRRRGALRS